MKIFGLILGGLGVYFFGSAGLRITLQTFATRQFRLVIAKWTNVPSLAALWGFLLGLIIESAAVVAVVLGGLITRGSVAMPLAKRLSAWSNLGLVVLVFLTTVDLETVDYYLMGVSGICLAFNILPRFRQVISLVFHLAMILLGLRLMKEGLLHLPELEWFQGAAKWVGTSGFPALLLGVVLRIPVQSSSAVAIIGATLYQANIFNEFQAYLMLAGTGMGTGLALYITTNHLRGEPRQIALYQGLVNAIAGAVFTVMLLVESISERRPLHDGFAFLSDQHNIRFAFAFFTQQTFCVGAGWLVTRFAPGLLDWFSPSTLDQQLSRPYYIYDEAVRDPEVALDLAEKEQTRLSLALGKYLDGVREDTAGSPGTPCAVLHQAAVAVSEEIHQFLGAIASLRLSPQQSARVLKLERQLGLFQAIEDAAFSLASTFQQRRPSPALAPVIASVIEGAATVLLQAAEVAGSRDAGDAEFLRKMTENRGSFLETLRQSHLDSHQDWNHEDKSLLFQVTSQFEHLVSLLHRFSISIAKNADAGSDSRLPAS